jgi:hypothetical protein
MSEGIKIEYGETVEVMFVRFKHPSKNSVPIFFPFFWYNFGGKLFLVSNERLNFPLFISKGYKRNEVMKVD